MPADRTYGKGRERGGDRPVVAFAPNWLGDAVMCTPALRALSRHFAKAPLIVAGRPGPCAVLSGLPWIAEFHVMSATPGWHDLGHALRALAPRRPQAAAVFPHSFRSALTARLTGARRRAGQRRNGRGFLLTEPVEPCRVAGAIEPIYMADEYLELVAALGCEDDGAGLELAADDRAVAAVKEHLVGPGPFVGIAPGAAYGPSKRWPAERYAAVADTIQERTGAQCVLLTGPGEEETRDAVRKAARYPLTVCDEGRPTVDSLKATVSLLDVLVGNDSGPRHVAVAFRVPTVCLMGPTRPEYSCGPYERGRVLRVPVDCGPCQKPVCTTNHRCMTGIGPEAVVEVALAYLPKARV